MKRHQYLLVLISIIASALNGNAITSNSESTDSLIHVRQQFYDRNIVLLSNPNDLLPLKHYKLFSQFNIISGVGFSSGNLDSCWNWYSKAEYLTVSSRPDYKEITEAKKASEGYGLIFLHLMPSEGDFSPQIIHLAEMMPDKKRVVLVLYCPEATASRIRNIESFGAVILGLQPEVMAMSSVVRGIFGGIPFTGTTANGKGIQTKKIRINYCSSRESGINPERFDTIDSIVSGAISSGAFPGCQVLAVWKGNVIFEKCYGTHTRSNDIAVIPTDLYDLASLTKIIATTTALIQLDNLGIIDVDKRLGKYFTTASGTNKENLKIKEILSHRARLQSWIPFYKSLVTDGQPDSLIFSNTYSINFPLKVSDSLYISASYTDTMLSMILNSPLNRSHDYLYSDLGMIMLKFMIEEQTKVPFEEYLDDSIFNPLNLFNIGYNAYLHYPLSRVVPTEDDRYFRNSLLHGFVHDPAAAMMGGVAGHAGLFANARDIAVIMYTLSNGGNYGGASVFDPETINRFNTKHYRHLRRGLGFDKPESGKESKPNVTSYASEKSFGHSGFTGTFTWADPEHDLVYVFLSNRVNPTAENPLLTSLGIRTKIHTVLYEAILNK